LEANVIWKGNLSFEGKADTGISVPLGTSLAIGRTDDGFRPMELILIGLIGCTAMDVISILQKKKQDVTHFEVKAEAERAEEHPKVFTKIVITFIVKGNQVDPAAVDRAIELSSTKYCPANTMLGKVVPIEMRSVILEPE
jgi:putative redox protein